MKIGREKLLSNVYNIILIIVLLFGFNSVYYRQWNGARFVLNSYIWLISVVLLLIFDVMNIKKILRRISTRRSFFAILLYFVLFGIILVCINKVGTEGTKYLRMFGVFFPLGIGFFLIKDDSELREFGTLASKVIFYWALISAVVWIAGPILGIVKSISPMLVKWGQVKYFENYLGISFAYSSQSIRIFGHNYMRNLSIFTEAPMSGMVFSLGFALYELINEDRTLIKSLFYYVLVVTTGSTTGIAIATAILCFTILKHHVMNSIVHDRVYYLAWGIGICIISMVILLALFYLLKYKAATSINSYSDHFADLFDGMRVARNNIVAGVGMGDSRNNVNYTSGAIHILTEGGLIYFSIYFVPFLSLFADSIKRRKLNYFVFITILLTQFVLVICQDTMLFLFIMSLGYAILARK